MSAIARSPSPNPDHKCRCLSIGHSRARPVTGSVGHPGCSASSAKPRPALARPNNTHSCRRLNPAITTPEPNSTGSVTQIPIA